MKIEPLSHRAIESLSVVHRPWSVATDNGLQDIVAETINGSMTPSLNDSMMQQLFLPLGRGWGPDSIGAGPERAFARVFRRLGLRRPVPDFRVEYCAFAGLRSTIRLRDNLAQVRISDLFAGAPPLVLEALAEILLAQVFRRRPSREARECYLAYVFSPDMRRRTDETRRLRGFKRLRPARGRCFDLEEVFAQLNRRFFQGELPSPRLGWSPKRSRSSLGHYDSAHGTIAVSRWLDSPSVPRYLIEYLVFHEMLHIRYPVERRGHRRIVHPRKFREAEKKFPKYAQARRRLKLICS